MTVQEICGVIPHKEVEFCSVRTGRTSRRFVIPPKNILPQWTPGYVLHNGILTIDVDKEVA